MVEEQDKSPVVSSPRLIRPSGPVVADFEACPADIATFYNGVTFSSGWKALVPANDEFAMRGKVAIGGESATIVFASPLRRFEGYMTSPQTETRIVGKNASGAVVGETRVFEVNTGFSLKASGGIETIEIVGGANQWALDDLSF